MRIHGVVTAPGYMMELHHDVHDGATPHGYTTCLHDAATTMAV